MMAEWPALNYDNDGGNFGILLLGTFLGHHKIKALLAKEDMFK